MSFDLETTAPAPLLDLDRLERDIERLRTEYQTAAPYPHIVIDDFLEPAAAKSAMSEFPPLDPEQWTNYLHVNERKFSNTDPSTWGPVLQQVLDELNSPRFVQFVGELLGVDNLIADPSLEGGDSISRPPVGSSTFMPTTPSTPTIGSGCAEPTSSSTSTTTGRVNTVAPSNCGAPT